MFARYADTNGFETNRERKTAYPYRDYLIESLNADKPYDRFITEQIAGDVLGEEECRRRDFASPGRMTS